MIDLLKEARQHLPLAAQNWSQCDDAQVADYYVPRVLDLIKRIDVVLAAGQPETCRPSDKLQEVQAQPLEVTDEQIDAIAAAMPGGMDGFLKGWGWRQFAREILGLRAPPTWEPEFDAMSPKQEALAVQFCAKISGKRGEPFRGVDPVGLLEMAQALYEAEREDAGQ